MLNETLKKLTDFYESYQTWMTSRLTGVGDIIRRMFIALMVNGHILVEGPPGLGKTTLVKHFAKFFKLQFSRVQFTPDLMPLDIIGSNIIQEKGSGRKEFEFFRGPIFANIVLGDEINRATPKTQSACLEAMEERKITFLGTEYQLPDPFMFIGTQNPIELEGTYPLPEAQIDRFLMKLFVDYPDYRTLLGIMETNEHARKVGDKEDGNATIEFEALLSLENEVLLTDDMKHYIARLIDQTHPAKTESKLAKSYILYGASPRAALALIRACKWQALLSGRINMSFDDIKTLAYDVLNHRLILNFEGESEGVNKRAVLDDIMVNLDRDFSLR